MLHCSHGFPITSKCITCVEEALEIEESRKFKPRKSKKCKQCKAPFIPRTQSQNVCGPVCAQKFAQAIREKKERKETRSRLAEMQTLPQLKKKAQIAFNAFIRERDKNQSCISCGAPPPDPSKFHGGRDAGHYRSVGSAPHLRFEESNCNSQCVHCNQFGAGRAVDYRIGLIARIGKERVEALEADQTPRHFTREHLLEIAETYRKKTRELKQKMLASSN